MKLRNILLGFVFAGTVVNSNAQGNFINARVDYYNQNGERIYSFNGSGPLLTFNPNDNGTFEVKGPVGMKDVAEVRFVANGEESYPLEMEVANEDIKLSFEVGNPSQTKVVSKAPGSEILSGLPVTITMDIPQGYLPKIKMKGLYTGIVDDVETETESINWINTILYREIMQPVSWINHFYREFPWGITYFEYPEAYDASKRNRYFTSFNMPNEPVIMTFDCEKVDITMLKDLMKELNHSLTTTWGWGGGIFQFQYASQGESAMANLYGEYPGSDCYLNYIYDFMPSWSVFYNMDGLSGQGRYVWSAWMWGYAYALISHCNEILTAFDNMAEDDANQPQAKWIKAQTLTLRAHAYFRLLQVYAPRWEDSNNGDMPTVIMRLSPYEPQKKGVATMNEVLSQCYSDLDEAIAAYKKVGQSLREHTYEPDLSVAYGIYARVAALKHDWMTVKTMAHNAREGKRIATSEEIFNGYTSYNDNEWLWSPSFEEDDHLYYANLCTFLACNGYYANLLGATAIINRDLYKLIPEGDERANWWFTYEKLSEYSGDIAGEFHNGRIVMAGNMNILNNSYRRKALSWINAHKPANITGSDAYSGSSQYEYSVVCDGAQIKYWVSGKNGLGEDGRSQVPYMRATEMWLYEAEACAELGLDSEAQNLLIEVNKPRNPNYTCELTGQSLLDEIRLYRRIELWGEGFCWFDLKRWNVPMTRTAWVEGDANSGNVPDGVSVTVPTSHAYGWRYSIGVKEHSYNDQIYSPVPGTSESWEEPLPAPDKKGQVKVPGFNPQPVIFDNRVPSQGNMKLLIE